MTRGDSKPEAAQRLERPVEWQGEPEADPEPGASLAVQRKGRPNLEKDRLEQQIHELDPRLLVEKEERWKERPEVYANKQVLAGVGAPAPRKHEPGYVGHQETRLADDVGVRLSVEPGGPRARAEREREPTIPAAIESVPRALRARMRGKRRKDEDRADDHP